MGLRYRNDIYPLLSSGKILFNFSIRQKNNRLLWLGILFLFPVYFARKYRKGLLAVNKFDWFFVLLFYCLLSTVYCFLSTKKVPWKTKGLRYSRCKPKLLFVCALLTLSFFLFHILHFTQLLSAGIDENIFISIFY